MKQVNHFLIQVNAGTGEHRVWPSIKEAAIYGVPEQDGEGKEYTKNIRSRESNLRHAINGMVPTVYGSIWILYDATKGLNLTEVEEIVKKRKILYDIGRINWASLSEQTLAEILRLAKGETA